MAIFIETSEGAQCKNKHCKDYRSWEEYEFSEVKDDGMRSYYICRGCGERIYMD